MRDRWVIEQATVISRDGNFLWVAAEKTSACSACRAKSTCGTALLAKAGSQQVVVRALIDDSQLAFSFNEGEQIELGVDRNALVKAALIMYLTPLVGLMAGVLLAIQHSEPIAIVAAILGIALGGWFASVLLKRRKDDLSMQPVVLGFAKTVQGEEAMRWQAPTPTLTKP